MNKPQIDKETIFRTIDNFGLACTGSVAFIGITLGILTLRISVDQREWSLIANINRVHHEQSKVAAKKHNVSPPRLTLRTDPHSSLVQLEQCNLASPQQNLVNYCEPLGAYLNPNMLFRVGGKTHSLKASLNFAKWLVSRQPTLIATLAIAKHITHEKGLGRDAIERTQIEYCLVGSQVSSIYGTSELTLQYFLDEHLAITGIRSLEDISPVEQQIAIAKGWSGEDCY